MYADEEEAMSITRLADSGTQAGPVGFIDGTAILSSDRLVTAVRTTSGKLKLISWEYDNNGAVSRLGDSGDLGGDVTNLAVPKVSAPSEICTFYRSSAGTFRLIKWKLNLATGALSVVNNGPNGGKVTALGCSLGAGKVVITASRDISGKLKLNSWNTEGLTQLSSAQAGGVSDLAQPIAAGDHAVQRNPQADRLAG
jgi:hypothetical protein